MPKIIKPLISKAGTDPTAPLFADVVALVDADPVVVVEPPALPAPEVVVVFTVPVVVALLPVVVVVFPPTPSGPVAVSVTPLTLIAAPLTLGILVALAWNSTMLLVVELKFVCAIAIKLFDKSYTTYADLRNVSPRVLPSPPLPVIPSAQGLAKGTSGVADPSVEKAPVRGKTSSEMGTEMLTPVGPPNS